MSRMIVHDVSGYSLGELQGFCNRGWTLIGDGSTEPGGETTIQLSQEQALKKFINFGKLLRVERPPLPAWAGVIDTPWAATLPVTMTVYNIEYLLSLRSPDEPLFMTGSTAAIVGKVIELINAQEETFLRLGRFDRDNSREETLDQRPFWDQLIALIQRSGMQMQLRPEVQDGRLYIFVDILNRVGVDTDFLFHDGENANMRILEANIDGRIRNRVIGINDKNVDSGRLSTAPQLDTASRNAYRLRSEIKQFNDITEASTLLKYTQVYLAASARPRVTLKVAIEDKGDAFKAIGLGNSAIFHASGIYLPGGIKGWRGVGIIKVIAYDEGSNAVGMTVDGEL